jgi:CHAT domain-containing protein/tetratricopeptide (TPR) repeat protein
MQILKSFPKSIAFLCFSVALLSIGITLPHYAQNDSSNTNTSSPPDLETAEEYFKAGLALQKEGNFKEDTPLFQQALGLYAEEENWNKVAETVYYATKRCNCGTSGKFNGPVIEASLKQLEPLLADTSYWLGRLYFSKGIYYKKAKGKKRDHKKAIQFIQKAKKILLLHNIPEDVIAADFIIARELKYIYQDKQAGWDATLNALVEVAKDARNLPLDHPNRKEIHKYILQKAINKSKAARSHIKKEKEFLKKEANWNNYVNTSNMLSQAYFSIQNYSSMKEQLEEAIAILAEHKMPTEYEGLPSQTFYLLGTYYRQVGDLEQALVFYKKAEQSPLKPSVKLALYQGMGMLYLQKNDLENASLYFKNLEVLAKETKNAVLEGRLPHDLGWIQEQKNYLNLALKLYKESHKKTLKQIQKRGDNNGNKTQSLIHTNHAIARVNYKLNRPDSAFYYLNLNQYLHNTPSRYYPKGASYHNYTTNLWFGKIYTQKRDFENAKISFDKALEQANEVPSHISYDFYKIHQAIADHYYAQVRWKEVLQSSQTAIQKLIPSYPIASIEALPDYKKTPFLRELWELVLLKSKVFEQQGKTKLAYQHIQHAILIINALQNGFNGEDSKLFITQVTIPTYELAIDLAIKSGDKAAAFSYSEQSKSILLFSALKNNSAKKFGSIPDSLIQKETDLAQNVVAYEKLLFEAENSKDTLLINIYQPKILNIRQQIEALQVLFEREYPKYYELKYQPRIATVKQTQDYINDATLLIEYFVGDSNIYVFAIQKEDFVIHTIKKEASFNKMTNALYRSLKNIEKINTEYKALLERFSSNSYQIYQQFLAPVLVPNIKQLIIVPSGQFANLPFEVFLQSLSNKQKTSDFTSLDYLIKDYIINYQYSTSLMLYFHPQLSNNGKVLAMAASYDLSDEEIKNISLKDTRAGNLRSSLNPIPGTKKEVETLQKSFHGKFLVDKEANETAFKSLAQSHDFSIIHMAMHGIVNKRNPEYSCMALTKEPKDSLVDDLLYAYEINLLDLQANLVVLSACETGYGKYERGEGVMSIGRGFMYAGVPSLVMTLWPLSDGSGPFLIEKLYQGLADGLHKDQALRQAKLAWLQSTGKKTAHPFFWASFITLGDNSPIYVAEQSFFKDNWMYFLIGVLGLGSLGFVFKRRKERA